MSQAGEDSGLSIPETPVISYYKSRGESPPVLYVQREATWEGYGRDGALWERGEGRLSFHTLAACQEIPEAEAERLVSTRKRKSSVSRGTDLRSARDVAEFVPRELRFRIRQFAIFSAWSLLVASVVVGIAAATMAVAGRTELLQQGARGWIGLVFATVYFLGVFLFYGPWYVSRPLRMNVVKDCVITVDENQITGPEIQRIPWCWRRMTIPLAHLDRIRSAKQTLIDRLMGRQHLWSNEGRKIYFPRSTFSRADVRELCRRLEIGG